MDLAEVVGGLDPSMGVQCRRGGRLLMTFSYDQIKNGDFIAYDPAMGDEKKEKEALTVIVAYQGAGETHPRGR